MKLLLHIQRITKNFDFTPTKEQGFTEEAIAAQKQLPLQINHQKKAAAPAPNKFMKS